MRRGVHQADEFVVSQDACPAFEIESESMPISVRQKRKAFAKLHEEGCFVLPNPWDLGSLRRLERLGFPAVATTSAGLAWSRGKEDYGITRDEAIASQAKAT